VKRGRRPAQRWYFRRIRSRVHGLMPSVGDAMVLLRMRDLQLTVTR
jgi:hypothetical protein